MLIQPDIKRYRQLNDEEAALMNAIEEQAEICGVLIERLRTTGGLDYRWVSIGATDLQKGFMALVRSVAKPTSF